MARSGKREAHPLTAELLLKVGTKVAVRPTGAQSVDDVIYRHARWREREGEWAISQGDQVHFIRRRAEGGYPPYRVWTADERREWENNRAS